MPEGVGYGPQNTASLGLNLNVIGKHAYAYSGVVPVTQSTITLLLFETGAFYVKGILAIQNGSGSGDDMTYKIELNGETMVDVYAGANPDQSWTDQFPIHLIFPPFTTVLVTAYNNSSGAGRNHTATFEGRIYK